MRLTTTSNLRLITGFVQGVLLYILYHAYDAHVWPATDATVFACFVTVVVIVPLITIINIGTMRFKTLLAWCLGLAVLLMVLVIHDIHRRAGLAASTAFYQYLPTLQFVTFVGAGIFIAQCLIAAGDAEKNYIASYPRYFDVAWKLAIQINFSVFFVMSFWLIIWTGSSLFSLINITFVHKLITHGWFNIPATTLAMAYALHLTDVRVNLVRGIRTMKLTLLSWLLPLITFFVTFFLISLPFAGLPLLWKTHHTSQIMLATAAWIILLINAAYQDGTPEHTPPTLLRMAGRVASVTLLPMVALATYALWLRIHEYGLTIHLVEVTACALIAICYAVGYMRAVFTRGPWLHGIEKTNIYTSFVIIVVLLSLFTPIADPARLAVADQMARLKDGRVTSDKFDYAFLSHQGGIYGAAALQQLKAEAPDIVAKEKIDMAALSAPFQTKNLEPLAPQDIAANITVYPTPGSLPASFANQDWTGHVSFTYGTPACLHSKSAKCEAYLVDDANDKTPEIIVTFTKDAGAGILYKWTDNVWAPIGQVSMRMGCSAVREALRKGPYKMVPATHEELDVNGTRVTITTNDNKCP